MSQIAIVGDGSDLILGGVRSLLLARGHNAISVDADSATVAAQLALFRPELVLLDCDGARAIARRAITLQGEAAPRVILLLRDERLPEPEVWVGLRVDGLVLARNGASVTACLEAVAAGHCWIDAGLDGPGPSSPLEGEPGALLLSPREQEVLHFIGLGLRNKEIARRLSVSEGTIKMHVHHISTKMGVQGRARIVAAAHARAQSNRSNVAAPGHPRSSPSRAWSL